MTALLDKAIAREVLERIEADARWDTLFDAAPTGNGCFQTTPARPVASRPWQPLPCIGRDPGSDWHIFR
jgi:hypothetical protein